MDIYDKIVFNAAEADAQLKKTFITEIKTKEVQQDKLSPEAGESASETDSEFGRGSEVTPDDGSLLYRSYIEKALKDKGLRKMLQ